MSLADLLMSLIERLQHLPDNRSFKGQRHAQWVLLVLMILGAISGYWGYRPLEEFTQAYGRAIYAELGVPETTRLPSYSTFRRLMQDLDYRELATVFTDWVGESEALSDETWFSGDGKAIRGTVTHETDAKQNFVNLVSLFGHHIRKVVGVMPMQNKQESEQVVLRRLLKQIALSGVGITMDALHCQKKPCNSSSTKAMSMSCVPKRIKSDSIAGLNSNGAPPNRRASFAKPSAGTDAT